MEESEFENMSQKVYSEDFEELGRLFFYSQELLRRLNKVNSEKSFYNMTLSQLRKNNEFLKNGLAALQRMLNA